MAAVPPATDRRAMKPPLECLLMTIKPHQVIG
jgi:hypothetical protein